MSTNILKMAGIGLAVVVVVVAALFFGTRGSQIRLEGTIEKVRVQAMDEKSCVVIVDFRFVNPANYPFVVRDALVYLDTTGGRSLKGTAVAAIDAKRLFDYYTKSNPDLGPQYNDSLITRDRVEPGESMERMVMARFGMPDREARRRARVRLRIEDVDGAITELREERE